jgi:hypothetical protein
MYLRTGAAGGRGFLKDPNLQSCWHEVFNASSPPLRERQRIYEQQ